MENEKKCKYCASMIPKDAKVCPHCRKRQSVSFLSVFIFIVFALLVYSYVMTAVSMTDQVSVGNEGYLYSGGDLTVVCLSEKCLDQWLSARRAKDETGQSYLINSGGVIAVKSGTKVLVLERKTFTTKIRIKEGDDAGIAGWVTMGNVKK